MSERNGYQDGVPCWVDTWRADADPAIGFYASLLGWEIAGALRRRPGHPFHVQIARPRRRRDRERPQGAPEPPAWGTYVWVDDADQAAATANRAGGEVIMAPFDSLDGGRMAILADPRGQWSAFGSRVSTAAPSSSTNRGRGR